MKLLITGAAGFMGSHLVKYFHANGANVLAMDLRNSDLKRLSAFSTEMIELSPDDGFAPILDFFRKHTPDAVLHLAALTRVPHERDSLEDLIKSNILLGTQLLQACVETGVNRFINTGTFWDSMDDHSHYRAANLYAATKRAFEDILLYYWDAFGIKALTLKLFGNYGHDDHRKDVFYYLQQSINSEAPIGFSPGMQRLDLVYIKDICRAYQAALEYVDGDKGNIYDIFEIGTGKGLSLRQVARLYEQFRGKRANIEWGKLPYRDREIFDRVANVDHTRALLNWEPHYDIEAGFKDWLCK